MSTIPNVLPDFSHARLLIVGDVMLDSYWYGPTGRISPEAPVPVVHVNKEEVRLGGAGNVAANTAALGVKTVLMGLVGEDESANHMQQLLSERGIDAHLQNERRLPLGKPLLHLQGVWRKTSIMTNK